MRPQWAYRAPPCGVSIVSAKSHVSCPIVVHFLYGVALFCIGPTCYLEVQRTVMKIEVVDARSTESSPESVGMNLYGVLDAFGT